MHELEHKRTRCSKTYDLGNGQYRCEIGQLPMHYECDGKWLDIDYRHEIDEHNNFALRNCPYTLKISGTVPAYEYNALSGKRVAVELITNASQPIIEGGLYKWQDVGVDTDYVIQPLPQGCATLLILHTPESQRRWTWRVAGDLALIRPLIGNDSAGRLLQLIERRNAEAGTIEVEWTGKAIAPRLLRKGKTGSWSDDITYPVVIDPTVNENIAAGADDVYSLWINSGATFSGFNAASTAIVAGRTGPYRLYAGVRFQTVAVPSGATVDSATLTVRVTAVIGTPNLNIFGNDVDDAAAWADPGNRVKNIIKTTAVTNKASWTNGADNSIDVATVVAEIVARAGWASNNDMAFGFFNNAGSGEHQLFFAALEHATLTEARLQIVYTAGGGGAARVTGSGLTESRLLRKTRLIA
jgi:hypothetical protein